MKTMHARAVMIVAVAAVALVGSACGRPRAIESRPDEIVDFPTLYRSNCAGCHGDDGRHGVAQPLNDATYLSLVDDTRLRDVISRGVPATPMAAFGRAAGGSLTEEQVGAIAAGVKREWGGATVVDPSLPAYSESDAAARGASAGDPLRGRTVFATYCARCHGDEGRGAAAGSVVDAAYLAVTSDQALRTAVIVGRADEGTPGWRDYVAGHPLSDQSISDVVAWLASHRGRDE